MPPKPGLVNSLFGGRVVQDVSVEEVEVGDVGCAASVVDDVVGSVVDELDSLVGGETCIWIKVGVFDVSVEDEWTDSTVSVDVEVFVSSIVVVEAGDDSGESRVEVDEHGQLNIVLVVVIVVVRVKPRAWFS